MIQAATRWRKPSRGRASTGMMFGHEIFVSGRVIRIAKLRHEGYEFFEDPIAALETIQQQPNFADLFTFVQDIEDRDEPHPFHREAATAAVLSITTYDHWWNSRRHEVRSKIRKAYKNGVELRESELNDDFVQGVQ